MVASQVRRHELSNWFISAYGCLALLLPLVAVTQEVRHWFIIPVYLCGVVIGKDAVDWARGDIDVFDPIGIAGLLGINFFFLSFPLHFYIDYWYDDENMSWITAEEHQLWFGVMAALNFVSLLAYRLARRWFAQGRGRRPMRSLWQLHYKKFWQLVLIGLCASAALQALVYVKYGGVSGYVKAQEARIGADNDLSQFRGTGWINTFSESFPILAFFAFTVYARSRRWRPSWTILALVLFGYVVALFIFGGIRGGRGHVVFWLFWALGLIHFWLRPITRKMIIIGVVGMFVFMNVYFFFKHGGLAGLASIGDPGARAALVAKQGVGDARHHLLLHYFSRAEIQSAALQKLWISDRDYYEYAWGRSYLGAFLCIVPRVIWANRPSSIRKERTEIEKGKGSFAYDVEVSRIYGLAGEVMLNFGPIPVPVAFALFGILVAKMQHLLRVLPRQDSRWLLLPLPILLSFLVMTHDSHLWWFKLFKMGLVPFLVVFFSSLRAPYDPEGEAPSVDNFAGDSYVPTQRGDYWGAEVRHDIPVRLAQRPS